MAIPAAAVLLAVAIGGYALTRKKRGEGEDEQERYDWTSDYETIESNLRKYEPRSTLTRLSSGSEINKWGEVCYWSVVAIDPPPPGGPYLGLVRCSGGRFSGEYSASLADDAKSQAIRGAKHGI